VFGNGYMYLDTHTHMIQIRRIYPTFLLILERMICTLAYGYG